jgi:hypothetical protein
VVGPVVRHLAGVHDRQAPAQQVVELDEGRQPVAREGPGAHPALTVRALGVVEPLGEVAEPRVPEARVEVARHDEQLVAVELLLPRLEGPQAGTPLDGVALQGRGGVRDLEADRALRRRDIELGLDAPGALDGRVGAGTAHREREAREHHRPGVGAGASDPLALVEVVGSALGVEPSQDRRRRLGEHEHVDGVEADGVHELRRVGGPDPDVRRHDGQVAVGLGRGRRPERRRRHCHGHGEHGDDRDEHPPPTQDEGRDGEQPEADDDERARGLQHDDEVCRRVVPAKRSDRAQAEEDDADGHVDPTSGTPPPRPALSREWSRRSARVPRPVRRVAHDHRVPGPPVDLVNRHLRPAARPG